MPDETSEQGTRRPADTVLLVEFVTTDRFHCALHYPHVKALLNHLGHETRWLRFAMKAAVQFMRDEEGIGLAPADRDRFGQVVADMGPTHVLFSHHPAASLLSVFDGMPGDARPEIGVFGSVAGLSTVEYGEALSSFANITQLQEWLGIESPLDIDLLAPPEELAFEPDYGFESANEAASTMQPFVFVLAGPECSYMHTLEGDPFFDDLIASGEVPRRFGCTFCRRPVPDGLPPRGMKPLDWAVRQIRAIAMSHPPSPTGELSLRVVGERVVQHVDQLAERVAALRLAPAEILVDCRADTLVRLRDRMAAAAETLGEAGHRLEICLIGVESFSADELRRFNKGYGPETNLAALRVLRELERDHPGAFGFRKYGGLSTVLYTPWTSIEDVSLALAVVRHFQLGRICGKVLTSRVRLYEELPLAAAARRDGLLVDRYEDPALDTARRNFYASELPWRFEDPRVGRFNRVATRLQADPSLADEPLYDAVQRWRADSQLPELELAERLCEAIIRYPEEENLEALMGLALAVETKRHAPRAEPQGVTEAARAFGDASATASPSAESIPEDAGVSAASEGVVSESEAFAGDAPAGDAPAGDVPEVPPLDPFLAGSVDWRGFVAGLKPVCRLEPLSADELARVEPKIRAAHPDAALRSRRRDWDGVESYELFVGRDAAEVDELVEILNSRDGGVRGDEGRAIVDRTGELLGYPTCCARRFADTPEVGWLHNEWLHVRNRVETPGEVPIEIRPLNGPLSYVTCSATCEASLAQAEVLRAAGDETVAPEKAQWPMLFLLDRPSHFAVLEPLSPVGERFRYRVSERYGQDRRFSLLAEGDSLEILPGQIRVLRDDEVLTVFSLDAYVWWHERAFHPEFWSHAVQQKLDPIASPDSSEGEEQGEEEDRGVDDRVPEIPKERADAEDAARVPRLDQVLGWTRRLLNRAGVACRSLLPTPAGDLDFVLDIEGRTVGLRWRNMDAPDGVLSLLGAPVVPLGPLSPDSVLKIAERLQAILGPAWKRVLRDRLDRGNREHLEVDPTQGIRFLLRKRIAAGRPLWGEYVLDSLDEQLGDDGVPRSVLVLRAGDVAVTVAFWPNSEVDGTGLRPLYSSSLGALVVTEDGRTPEMRRHVAHQIERCLGFHFSRAVPEGAVWGPVPPEPDED